MAKNNFTVTLSMRAEHMLILHTEFLSRVSFAAADKLIEAFEKAKDLLEENPLQYSFADDFDAVGIPEKTYRKRLFYDRYKMLYLIEGTNVYVDAIIDCRQSNSELY